MLADKYKCDPRVLRTFDLVGTFFVDVFYNRIYGRAKEAFMRGEQPTLTEAFMTYSMQYIKTLQVNRDTYKATVGRLYEFYKSTQGRPALSFVGFEEEIASTFFPRDKVKLMLPNDMDVILWEIVTQTIVDFATYLLSADMLAKIIDDHLNRDNVNKLQEKYVMLFMAKRDSYHEKIVKSLAGQRDTSVSGSAYHLLQTKLIKEASEHLKTRRDLQAAKAEIHTLQSRLNNTEKALTELATKLREIATLQYSENEVGRPRHNEVGRVRHSENENELGRLQHSENENEVGRLQHSENENEVGRSRHSENEVGRTRHSENEVGRSRHSENEVGRSRHSETGHDPWPIVSALPDQQSAPVTQEVASQEGHDLLATLIAAHMPDEGSQQVEVTPAEDYYEVVKISEDEW